MKEQDIVKDVLAMTKAAMGEYQASIADAANPALRSALQQLRDDAEQFQHQMYQLAEEKGYAKPADPATDQQLTSVKSDLSQS